MIIDGIESYQNGDNVFKGIIAGVVEGEFKQLLGFQMHFVLKKQNINKWSVKEYRRNKRNSK